MAKHKEWKYIYLYGQYANIRKDIFGTSRIRGIPSHHWYLSPINTRCIRAVSLMQPRSSPALPGLPPFFRLRISALHDQPSTYSWYNYAQYRTNPQSVSLISTPGLKWIIQANVMPTDKMYILLEIYISIFTIALFYNKDSIYVTYKRKQIDN